MDKEKIMEQLKNSKLNEEELEQVAGGSVQMSFADLNQLMTVQGNGKYSKIVEGMLGKFSNEEQFQDKVADVFSRFGVTVEVGRANANNLYFDKATGKEVHRADAINIAVNNLEEISKKDYEFV